MIVYQPIEMFFGALFGLGGLVMLCGSLYFHARHKSAFGKVRQTLVSSIYFLALAANGISQAFDLPHHESYRTNTIQIVAFPIALVCLAYVWLTRWQEKKVSHQAKPHPE